MARNFNGGTDKAWYVVPEAPASIATIAFWMRTTQTTANTIPVSYWGNTSRNGFGFILNGVAGKISPQGWGLSSNRITQNSTTSVNDGNPHHVAWRFGRGTSNGCQLFINGVQEATGTCSGDWNSGNTGFFIQLADQVDTFWPTYVGDLWEVGYWVGAVLSDDDIAALGGAGGKVPIAPPRIRPSLLRAYIPLVREVRETRGLALNSSTGGSVTDHGRVAGGLV